MTPEVLWKRYSAIWSQLDPDIRVKELAVCLSDDATYCDPNGLIEGRTALSDYMGGFQKTVAGGAFRIRSLLNHHDRTLANWSLHGPDGNVLQNGTSFGLLSEDGRLHTISGFFYPDGQDQSA